MHRAPSKISLATHSDDVFSDSGGNESSTDLSSSKDDKWSLRRLSSDIKTNSKENRFQWWIQRIAACSINDELLSRVFQCGYLRKEGSKMKTWKKRFFELKFEGIHYYRSEKSNSYLGSIPIFDCCVVECIPLYKGRENVFRIECYNSVETRTLERKFYLQSPSSNAMRDWMAKIQMVIDKYLTLGLIEEQDANGDDGNNNNSNNISDRRQESIDFDSVAEVDDLSSIPSAQSPMNQMEEDDAMQLDVAIGAYKIFMKDPNERKPEERAYVTAMLEYAEDLTLHMRETDSDFDRMPYHVLCSYFLALMEMKSRKAGEASMMALKSSWDQEVQDALEYVQNAYEARANNSQFLYEHETSLSRLEIQQQRQVLTELGEMDNDSSLATPHVVQLKRILRRVRYVNGLSLDRHGMLAELKSDANNPSSEKHG